jgi:hypothetical protein
VVEGGDERLQSPQRTAALADCLTGKSAAFRPALSAKINPFPSHPNHCISRAVSSQQGRLAIVTDAGRDAVDAAALRARGDRRAVLP